MGSNIRRVFEVGEKTNVYSILNITSIKDMLENFLKTISNSSLQAKETVTIIYTYIIFRMLIT